MGAPTPSVRKPMTGLQPASDDFPHSRLDEDVQSRAPEAADRLLIGLQIGAHHAEVGGKEVYGTGHGPEARTGVRYQSQRPDPQIEMEVRPRGIEN